MPWNPDRAMAQTLAQTGAAGPRVHETEALLDLDRPADLERRRACAATAGEAAPR